MIGVESSAALLQALIRFDTTNPPGNEAACIQFIAELLREASVDVALLAKDPTRPNLIARLRGEGNAPGLLLQGHVDVVPTHGQRWTHPPFDGVEADGYIWGRGALDMKSGVAMMIWALLRLVEEGVTPAGDIVLCVLCDEEAGGKLGARFLVEEHPELFDGMRYSLGEFGGFPLDVSGTTFYPIQVAEKLLCGLRLTIHGPAGHGSQPIRGGAMARLGRLLVDLDRRRTPVHITPVTRLMIGGMAETLQPPANALFKQMLNPRLTDLLIDRLGERSRVLLPLFHNTVSPTIVRGGSSINVIPGQITLDLDGRMLPGFTPEVMVEEVRSLMGGTKSIEQVEIEVLNYDPPGPDEPNMAHFDRLAGILRQLDPDGVPIPYLLPGVSDARFFAQLGIQNYGFTPMKLPPDFNFAATIHAADERIPVDAIDFGSEAIFRILQQWGESEK